MHTLWLRVLWLSSYCIKVWYCILKIVLFNIIFRLYIPLGYDAYSIFIADKKKLPCMDRLDMVITTLAEKCNLLIRFVGWARGQDSQSPPLGRYRMRIGPCLSSFYPLQSFIFSCYRRQWLSFATGKTKVYERHLPLIFRTASSSAFKGNKNIFNFKQ